MSGTHAGGLKCAATNMKLQGKDFYRIIDAKGGKACGCKGFAKNPELAKKAGSKGGKASKRGVSIARKQKIKKALELKANGYTIKQLAKEFRVSYQTMCVWLRNDA